MTKSKDKKTKKRKGWIIPPIIIIALMTMFLMGFILGMVLQQSHFIKGAVLVAEGLEGTEFNIEVDINETIMVDRMIEFFNETWRQELNNNSST